MGRDGGYRESRSMEDKGEQQDNYYVNDPW
jgi:hypothetical protein